MGCKTPQQGNSLETGQGLSDDVDLVCIKFKKNTQKKNKTHTQKIKVFSQSANLKKYTRIF